MKYFLRVFFVFALTFFINFATYALEAQDISLQLKNVSAQGIATFEISLPSGWKLAKSPDIVSKHNLLAFSYQENFKQISENKYETKCTLDKNQKDVLKFDFFVCKDICSVVSKDFMFSPDVFSQTPSVQFFIIMLCFGFIGGLLLNVMPCVLPVILLKMKHVNSRKTMINSIIGNYFSFLLLATLLSILKLSGETIGWGMHFHNVYFLKFTVVFFFILCLISFDKIQFYWSLHTDKFKFSEKNWPLLSKHGAKFIHDVISSMITTFLAIPCTAPLLGTAATFAMQESISVMFVIFVAIATGFSFPYFLILFFKFSFENLFQKTLFNKIINCGVLIIFAWLVWILQKNITLSEILFISIVFLISFILFKKNHNRTAILLLISVIFINIPQKTAEIRYISKLAEISKLVKQNNVVILNITADWCLSCKYNKLKFESRRIQSKMRKDHIKFIEIDITRKNNAIMNFIRQHSRIGIPFTIIYGPNAKSGILLSEIPSISEIVKTIDLVK